MVPLFASWHCGLGIARNAEKASNDIRQAGASRQARRTSAAGERVESSRAHNAGAQDARLKDVRVKEDVRVKDTRLKDVRVKDIRVKGARHRSDVGGARA
jgi:hypothetical protein